MIAKGSAVFQPRWNDFTYAATTATCPASMIDGVIPGVDLMMVALPAAIPSTEVMTLLVGRPAFMAAAETSGGKDCLDFSCEDSYEDRCIYGLAYASSSDELTGGQAE